MAETVAAVAAAVEAITAVDVAIFAAKVVASAAISRALAPKPPSLDFTSAARARKTAIRSPVASRTVIYGEARVAGPLVYAGSSGSASEYLHLVMPLAGHEVDSIGDVYLTDKLSNDAQFSLTDTTQTYKTVDFLLDGTYAGGETVSVTLNGQLYSTSGAGSLAATVAALVAAAQADPANNCTITSPAALTLRATGQFAGWDFAVAQVAGPSMAWTVTTVAEPTTTTTTAMVRVAKHLGGASQSADADLVAESAEWTSAHRLRGVAYLYLRLTWNATAFPTGMPVPSAVVRGKQLYDPRTGVTAWSDNPALAILDYLRNAEYGLGADDDEIDFSSFVAAANVCDEPVAVAAGGTTARYTCNGVVDMAQRPDDVVEQLLTSLDGRLVYAQGTYRLHAGAAAAPSWAIDEDDLAGEIKIRPTLQRAALYNVLKGTYIDPSQHWEAADYPAQTSAAWLSLDGGEEITRDLPLPFTTDPAMAQRIARLVINRSRLGAMTVEARCKMTVFPVAVWDVVTLTNAALGIDAVQFRVADWRMEAEGGITLTLTREDSAIYDWDATTDEVVVGAAPDTTLPDLTAVPPPTDFAVVSSPLVTAEGVVVPRLAVTWTAPDDAFLVGYQLQYKPSTETDYVAGYPLARVTETVISYLHGAVAYDVRLRAVNGRGATSAWVEAARIVAAGDTTAPAAPSGVSATGGAGEIVVDWVNPSDSDFSRAEVYEHTSNDSASATLYGTVYGLPAAAGTITRTGLGSGVTRYYWIKALDASGNRSAFSSGANATTT